MKLVKSPEAVKAVAVGLKNRKTFRPMRQRGVITEWFREDDWWFEPYEQTRSIVPAEALRRVEILRSNGVGIKGMVIAHEAPLALMAPVTERQTDHFSNGVKVAIVTLVAGVAVVVAMALTAPLVAVAVPTASVLSLPLLLTTAVLVDPCLIVVLSDGTWLEVCRWDESYG